MNELDWSQKYRPKKFDDLVLPPGISTGLRKLVADKGGMPVMFSGESGSGKTTVAQMINPDETLFLNCAIENSIAMVRKLEQTCSAVTFSGERRIVVLDEADYLTKDAQAGLRGLVEKFSSNNCFVMTANDPKKLSVPIKSRFSEFAFEFMKSSEFIQALKDRLTVIAVEEGHLNIDKYLLKMIVDKHFPDIRAMIKTMQRELMNHIAMER